MAWEQRAEPGRELIKGLLTLVVVAGAGLTAISLAVAAADGFARWIIDSSLHGHRLRHEHHRAARACRRSPAWARSS